MLVVWRLLTLVNLRALSSRQSLRPQEEQWKNRKAKTCSPTACVRTLGNWKDPRSSSRERRMPGQKPYLNDLAGEQLNSGGVFTAVVSVLRPTLPQQSCRLCYFRGGHEEILPARAPTHAHGVSVFVSRPQRLQARTLSACETTRQS